MGGIDFRLYYKDLHLFNIVDLSSIIYYVLCIMYYVLYLLIFINYPQIRPIYLNVRLSLFVAVFIGDSQGIETIYSHIRYAKSRIILPLRESYK